MKVTQEKLPASQIGLEIEISAENSQNTYEKVVRNLAHSTNIPGFRKGKVPRQILIQRLGPQRIKATVLEELIQESLKQAVEQESIESLGNYKLRSNFDELIQQYKPGEPLTFSASFDVPPTPELGDYQSLKVKAEETAYDPSQVDDFLEQRRAEQGTLVPVEDRPAKMGDVAVVDYQGRFAPGEGEESEEIPGTQATDFQMELAEGKFVEGMVEGMVGMKPEETKEISVTFPEDYAKEDLAGKAVVFTITLKELKEKELPDLDDDFAEEVSEFETLAELRESLENQFQEKAAQETKNSIHEAIIAQLTEQSSVDLPETMIQQEVDMLIAQTAMQLERLGIDINKLLNAETVPQMRERSRPEAIERLEKSLILAEIAKRESIELEPEAVEAKVKEMSAQLSGQEFDMERLRTVVEEDLLEEKTLNWLQEKAAVELVPKGSLDESEAEETQEEEAATSEETENAQTVTEEPSEP